MTPFLLDAWVAADFLSTRDHPSVATGSNLEVIATDSSGIPTKKVSGTLNSTEFKVPDTFFVG
jgi:hypothetical protein